MTTSPMTLEIAEEFHEPVEPIFRRRKESSKVFTIWNGVICCMLFLVATAAYYIYFAPYPVDKLAQGTPTHIDHRPYAALARLSFEVSRSQSWFPTKSAPAAIEIGVGYGGHYLLPSIPHGCTFQSWGIEQDWSFDKDMSDKYACTGQLFDPTVNYSHHMYEGLTFYQKGHPIMGWEAPWPETTPLEMYKASGWSHLDVLKMDCEGCEYYFGKYLEENDPHFFDNVGQFNLEIHGLRKWAKTPAHVESLGLLLHFVYSSGLSFIDVEKGRCGPQNTREYGVIPEMRQFTFISRYYGCTNFLFARTS